MIAYLPFLQGCYTVENAKMGRVVAASATPSPAASTPVCKTNSAVALGSSSMPVAAALSVAGLVMAVLF
jgi:hypothetical protein